MTEPRKWYLESFEPLCSKGTAQSIDRNHGVTYWKLVDGSEPHWRICTAKLKCGCWSIWSRGTPVLIGDWIEELHRLALTYALLTGHVDGYGEQDIPL